MKIDLPSFFRMLIQIINLPVARLSFHSKINPDNINSTYAYFTKPHPKYKLIKNKSVGAALIDLGKYRSGEDYLNNFNGHNSIGYHSKKAQSRGYVLVEIDRNDYVDAIHDINTSLEVRQGHKMDISYTQKKTHYQAESNYKYYGVLNRQGKLVAYCNLGFYGDFASFSQLIGYRNNDGVMHFMLTSIICQLIDARSINYLMYDTYFGAQTGLKKFKSKFGFEPYLAKYSIL